MFQVDEGVFEGQHLGFECGDASVEEPEPMAHWQCVTSPTPWKDCVVVPDGEASRARNLSDIQNSVKDRGLFEFKVRQASSVMMIAC